MSGDSFKESKHLALPERLVTDRRKEQGIRSYRLRILGQMQHGIGADRAHADHHRNIADKLTGQRGDTLALLPGEPGVAAG